MVRARAVGSEQLPEYEHLRFDKRAVPEGRGHAVLDRERACAIVWQQG